MARGNREMARRAIGLLEVQPEGRVLEIGAVAGLREARRVLKPAGGIALGFTRHSGQGKDGLAETLATAGFTDARVIDVDGEFCVVATKSGGNGNAAT